MPVPRVDKYILIGAYFAAIMNGHDAVAMAINKIFEESK